MATDELFDVVDAGDRVLWTAPRAQVHRMGWTHRAVHIWVQNGAGEIFLQRRSATKDTFPGCWDSSCSGHVDAGEQYGQAARRELTEELGLTPPPDLRPLARIAACPATGHEHVWLYLAHHDGPFRLDPAEISEGRWLPPAEIDAWLIRAPTDFARSFTYLWHRLRSALI